MARRLMSLCALTLALAPVLTALPSALAAKPSTGAVAVREAASSPLRPQSLRNVVIGMGYIPNVQFAPYYVADQRGYYRRAGLKVTFSYAFSPNLMELTGAGKVDFANADGTDAIAAEAQGVPIVYVMAEYQRLPAAIFALAVTFAVGVIVPSGPAFGVVTVILGGSGGLLLYVLFAKALGIAELAELTGGLRARLRR